jgi:hypothetical protein
MQESDTLQVLKLPIALDGACCLVKTESTPNYCDQTNAQSIGDFRKSVHLSASSVDIIVDDGLHNVNAAKCLFGDTIDLLRRDGTYVIEDVARRDRKAFAEYFAGRQDEFFAQFLNLHRPNLSLWDNSPVVFRKKQ